MMRHSVSTLLVAAAASLLWARAPVAAEITVVTPDEARVQLGSTLDELIAIGQALLDSKAAQRRGDKSADGGGASVADLVVIQYMYLTEDPYSDTFWIWRNPTPNMGNIIPYVNGSQLVSRLTHNPVVLPGNWTWIIVGTDSPDYFGKWTCEIEGGGNVVTDVINVLGDQPFDDPTLTGVEGPMDPDTKLCSLEVEISNSRVPTWYIVTSENETPWNPDPELIENPDNPGNPLSPDVPGTARSYSVPGLSAGKHCVSLMGWLADGVNGDYLGDHTECCADLRCDQTVCVRLRSVQACQVGFGAGETDNAAELNWKNGVKEYKEILVTLDGTELEPLSGTTETLLLENLAPGQHDVTLTGNCGEQMGSSQPVSLRFSLLTSPPQVSPPRNLSCRFVTSDYSRITMTWNNVDTPDYYEVQLLDPEGNVRVTVTVSGMAHGTNLEQTLKTDTVGIRGFFSRQGACFWSTPLTCVPSLPPGFKYRAGDCDASTGVDLTDAIYSLNHLFRGGEAPICAAACDSNKDERHDITDGIYTLNYLFLSGPPPQGKYPDCDEGYPDDPLSCPRQTCNP